MLKLEARPQASRLWAYGSPLLALAITVLIGVALFAALGKDPLRGLQVFFWEPIKSPYALVELALKATPLLLIALMPWSAWVCVMFCAMMGLVGVLTARRYGLNRDNLVERRLVAKAEM